MRKKSVVTLLLSCILVLGWGVLSNFEVSAAEPEPTSVLSDNEVNTLKEWFTMYDVPQNIQEDLINKLNDGELWDVHKESATPIKIETGSNVEGNYVKETYLDGSISVTITETVEDTLLNNPNDLIYAPMSAGISGGKIVSSSFYHTHYKDVKVSMSTGVITASYLVEYVTNRSAYDELIAVYNPNILIIGGTFSDVSLGVVRQYENSTYDAEGKLQFGVHVGGIFSGLIRLHVYVGNDNIWATHN